MNYEAYTIIKTHYEKKRLEVLKKMAEGIDAISFLNTLLLDDRDDVKPIKSLSSEFMYLGKICKIVNVGDRIQNKSRQRIAYLLPDTEMTRENSILFQQINLLASKGHEILIYSHFPQPEGFKCKAFFFQVDKENDLCSALSKQDIAVAGNWKLVPDILKVSAPLKYMLVYGESDLSESETGKDIKAARFAAFTAPVKIIADSEAAGSQIFDLFGRASIILFRKGSEGSTGIPEKFSLLRSAKILEREFVNSAQSTIQVIKLFNPLQ